MPISCQLVKNEAFELKRILDVKIHSIQKIITDPHQGSAVIFELKIVRRDVGTVASVFSTLLGRDPFTDDFQFCSLLPSGAHRCRKSYTTPSSSGTDRGRT